MYVGSLSYAKVSKNDVEQLLHADRPRDAPELRAGDPELLRREVQRHLRGLRRAKGQQAGLHVLPMPAPVLFVRRKLWEELNAP